MTVDVTQAFTRRRIIRDELIGLFGVVERNLYLTKRYLLWDLAFLLWTVANTLTIVFIARGVGIPPAARNELETKLLVGGVIWAFLGIIFEIVTETVAWERWEGTIEYTFMAPVSRPVHLIGMGVYAVIYGLVRAALVFFAVVVFIGIHLPHANYGAAIALLAIASISFIGVGMMTAVLPLVSPEKGTQLGFVAQGLMLVVSGVYYPVSVLPEWMQWVAKISPATYALRGNREQILNGAGLAWADVWPLLVIGAFSIPIGLAVFKVGERYAKQARQAQAVGMRLLDETDRDVRRDGEPPRRALPDRRLPRAVRCRRRARARASAPAGSRFRSRRGACACTGSTSRRTCSSSSTRSRAAESRPPRSATSRRPRSTDVLARLPRLEHASATSRRRTARSAASRNAAAHLAPGGSFVIELFVPQLQPPAAGETFLPFDVDARASRLRRVRRPRRSGSSRTTTAPRRPRRDGSGEFRYAWPSELDLMARLAGMTLSERWAGWQPRAVHRRVGLARLRLDARMIEVRPAESDEDLEAWRSVRSAILPNERTSSVAELRAGADEDTLWLLAYRRRGARRVAASRTVRSSGGAFTQPRVLPALRRRGVGTQILLHALADHALACGHEDAGAQLEEPGSAAFAERFGFTERNRQIEQVYAVRGDEPEPDTSRRRRDRAAPRPGATCASRAVPGARSRQALARPCRRPADRDHRGRVVVELDPLRRMGVPRARRPTRSSAWRVCSTTPTIRSVPRTCSRRCGETFVGAGSRGR